MSGGCDEVEREFLLVRPELSTNDIVASVAVPEERTRPSIASTDMGCDVRAVGILCARTNDLSMKQVDAPESSKA